MTTRTSWGDPDPLSIAQRILELHAAVYRNVDAGQYEVAARLRDERESLERQLETCGNPRLLRNIDAAKSWRTATVAKRLEPRGYAVDEPLVHKLSSAALPVRWAICNICEAPVGSLRRRLGVESIDSAHFMGRFPVISPERLGKNPHERIEVLAKETVRSKTAVVWICTDIDWLGTSGILEKWYPLFQHEAFEFVACMDRLDGPWKRQIAGLPGVTVVHM